MVTYLSTNPAGRGATALIFATPFVKRQTAGKQVRKVLWTRKGVRTTVVTAGHCTHAELSSGQAVACTPAVYAN